MFVLGEKELAMTTRAQDDNLAKPDPRSLDATSWAKIAPPPPETAVLLANTLPVIVRYVVNLFMRFSFRFS